jgi:uncharacterized membrane protein YbjE (DUF340 family)
MTDHLVTSVITVITAIIGVAIIAVLVSRNSNTAQVLTTGGQAFSQVLGTALSPVTGSGALNFTGGGVSIGI